MNSKSLLGISLLLGASFIWGVAYIPTRYLGEQNVSPFLELLIRYTIPFVIFGSIYFKKIVKTPLHIIKNCVLTGIVLFLAIVTSIYGIRMVQFGSMGLLLLSLQVIFVPIYFTIFKKQKLSLILSIAIILSFTGTIILTGATNTSLNLGALLCFLASLGYTLYIILCSKILTTDVEPTILQFYQSATFIVLCLPIVLWNSSSLQMINWSNPNLYYAFLFIGVCAGTLGYQFFFYGQKMASPITTSLILSTQIVFSAIADVLIFQIQLTNTQLLAYTCITIAVFLVPFQKKAKS